MVESSPVTRASLSFPSPIVAPRPMVLLPTRPWPDAQWERLRRGHAAHSMDEKWHLFVEERVAFLHRSWTGYGIFEATFAPLSGGGWGISAATVESDPTRYTSTSAEGDSSMLELVLGTIANHEPRPLFPRWRR